LIEADPFAMCLPRPHFFNPFSGGNPICGGMLSITVRV
jgi:hypothetical protein